MGNTVEEQHGNAGVILVKIAARVVTVVTDAVYATAAEVMFPIMCRCCEYGSRYSKDALDLGSKSRVRDCWYGEGDMRFSVKTCSNYLF